MNFAEVAPFVPALARAGGFAATAPLLGDASTPVRVRLVFTVAVAAAVTHRGAALTPTDAMIAAPLELVAGALPGLMARWILERVATGGQLIGLHLGLGFAQSYDPTASESATAARRLVATIAGLAFLAAGGLEAGVRAVATPVAHDRLAIDGAAAIALATQITSRAIAFAAPVIVAAVLINAGLAVVNRAAPAFNVFSIALIAVVIGGGLVLVAAAPGAAAAITDTAKAAVAVLGGPA